MRAAIGMILKMSKRIHRGAKFGEYCQPPDRCGFIHVSVGMRSVGCGTISDDWAYIL